METIYYRKWSIDEYGHEDCGGIFYRAWSPARTERMDVIGSLEEMKQAIDERLTPIKPEPRFTKESYSRKCG